MPDCELSKDILNIMSSILFSYKIIKSKSVNSYVIITKLESLCFCNMFNQ